MAGQIIKRGPNKYQVRIELGRHSNGKRNAPSRTVNGPRREVEKLLNRLLLERDTGQLVVQSRMSLDAFLDEWLEVAVKPRVRPGTHKEYADTLRRYVRPVLGPMRLSDVRSVDVQALYGSMRTAGKGGMVRLTHTLLKDALNQAVKLQYLGRNPVHFVDTPKRKPAEEMRPLNPSEVERFLRATSGTRWGTLLHVLVGTGVRPSEAYGLAGRDIDLNAGTLTVRRALVWLKEEKRFELNEPKSRAGRRTIVMPGGLVTKVSEHMAAQGAVGLDDLVFTTRDGTPARHRTVVKHAFKPTLKRAGLDEAIRMYDLRHTHATLLLIKGVHVKIVSERLGHASVAITLDTYSHVLPTMQQKAAEELDEILYAGSAEVPRERLWN